jgi:hypothetical protein
VAVQLTILTAPTQERFRFKAKVGEPYGLTVEAKDREVAYNAVVELMRARVPDAEFVRVDWPAYSPLFEICGSVDPSSPAQVEFDKILQENRRRENEAEGIYPERNEQPG